MGHTKKFLYITGNNTDEDDTSNLKESFELIIIKDPFNLIGKLGKKIKFTLVQDNILIIRKKKILLKINYDQIINWKYNKNILSLYFISFENNKSSKSNSSDDIIIKEDFSESDKEFIINFKLLKIPFNVINKNIYKFIGKYMLKHNLLSFIEYEYWLS
jgi:hypothetical protein